MTREERCQLAIERGYKYDPESGLIYNRYGTFIKTLRHGYLVIKIRKNKINYMIAGHQFAWYCVHKECVEQLDHINRIKDDNRLCNLRSVTHQQNQWNKKEAKGYHWCKSKKKWRAQIKVNNNTIYLGRFKTEDEAHQAYLNAKEKFHVILN